MNFYTTLLEAIEDLQRRGYVETFNAKENCVECKALNLQLTPMDFTLDEFYRFDDDSSTDNNSIVLAISSSAGVKGTIIDAYGVYAENLAPLMVEKLMMKYK
jgi:hypothetical protein